MPGIKEVAGIWDRNEQSLLTPLPQDSVHQTEETKHHSNENSENHTPNNIQQIKQPVEVLHTRSVHTHAQYAHTLSTHILAQYAHTLRTHTHSTLVVVNARSLIKWSLKALMSLTDHCMLEKQTGMLAHARQILIERSRPDFLNECFEHSQQLGTVHTLFTQTWSTPNGIPQIKRPAEMLNHCVFFELEALCGQILLKFQLYLPQASYTFVKLW